jgi:hypothetical protein
MLNGHDVLNQLTDLGPGAALHIVYKRSSSSVRGVVDNGEGATTLLWTQSSFPLTTLLSIPCGTGGLFQADGVRPGDYYAVAVDHADTLALSGSTVLSRLAQSATTVKVEDGATVQVNLKLMRWPE